MTDEHLIAEALRQENEHLKADNDRIQNNFIQQLEYEKQALDDAIKYKTCLQEIKEIAEEIIIAYTDIAKSNEKLKALDLRSRLQQIIQKITKAEEE